MNADIFKAYDVRGRVGTELTPEVCKKIGQAFADWLPEKGVVAVGRDMRPDSAELAAAVIDGLRAQGREVLDIGLVTSDMIYFAVGHYKLAGGAVITASHNPGDYNGIKFCREEAKPVGIENGLLEVRDSALKGIFNNPDARGEITTKNITEDWITHALNFVDAKKWPSYRIAIDAGNGMAGAIIPSLEKYVSLNITPMYFELDGTFPNHIANPLEPKNLIDLQAKVKEDKLDFGVAFDGDGDRQALIDETGEPLSGTVMTAMLAKYFLQKNPGATILYNVICGRAVKETIEALGGRAIRTRVGHSFIKADMRKYDALFAGEHSGHYYFKDNFSADSGLIAALIAIQVLADSGKKLSELVAEFKTYVSIPETNFTVDDKAAVIAELTKAFGDGEQDTLDGLTVNYPTAWFNVRPSNTEPLLRLNVEARTKEELDSLVSRVRATIEK
ncbi:MAG TPA: phosphomannomutase/phosphoglucomutase [Patescibacteria group bacterium]|jgi:phosphomannomutase|nr:phosphomannomutase/phosphoglucomutase [Patescibacteria group bacterium]